MTLATRTTTESPAIPSARVRASHITSSCQRLFPTTTRARNPRSATAVSQTGRLPVPSPFLKPSLSLSPSPSSFLHSDKSALPWSAGSANWSVNARAPHPGGHMPRYKWHRHGPLGESHMARSGGRRRCRRPATISIAIRFDATSGAARAPRDGRRIFATDNTAAVEIHAPRSAAAATSSGRAAAVAARLQLESASKFI